MTTPRGLPRDLLLVGAAVAFVGLVIVLWPERGLVSHPLHFPPSASPRPIAPFAVFGYPLLGAGAVLALAGLLGAVFGRGHSR